MKKVFFIIIFITGCLVAASGQKNFVGVDLCADFPVGDFSNTHSVGFGGGLYGQLTFFKKWAAILSAGYTSFKGKKQQVPGYSNVQFENFGVVALFAGPRFYPIDQFFAGIQGGYLLLHREAAASESGGFAYQPQVGYNGSFFQIITGFTVVTAGESQLNHFGITVAYKIGANAK
jgi:hypothetical protein